MVARIKTVAFQGIEVLDIDVQVQIAGGMPAFSVVGLADKAIGESRERVRAALHAIGLALPPKRITVNLAPADVTKEGSHFDLPIALGLLSVMDVIPQDALDPYTVLGELALDGAITPVAGVILAAHQAAGKGLSLICPAQNGSEAAWYDIDILAPHNLIALINHLKGTQLLSAPAPHIREAAHPVADLKDVKGQESAKRALEIAAAGGHNILMIGPPGSGKSMLAQRLPGLLPDLDAEEALQVTMVHSVAGQLKDGGLIRRRPYRDPHHSASLPALVGGGSKAKPGEISLAHHGVLFLDELPEFNRQTLESLRQPVETGETLVSRANHHVRYPSNFQLVAAMNPCRCGHLDDAELACSRAPKCANDYQSKISGPLFDRIDLHIDVPAVSAHDLSLPPPAEGSGEVRARVVKARDIQKLRYAKYDGITTNADANGDILDQVATPDEAGQRMLKDAATHMKLSARGYHRILRVARTIADLDHSEDVKQPHVAEALSYRRIAPGQF